MGRPTFTSDVLDAWRERREVEVETAAGPDAPEHRTIIWIVVDEAGRALIRSTVAERRAGTGRRSPPVPGRSCAAVSVPK